MVKMVLNSHIVSGWLLNLWSIITENGNMYSTVVTKQNFPREPGVWIHPEQNTIRVYMNTQENPLEYVDIENVPTKNGSTVLLY